MKNRRNAEKTHTSYQHITKYHHIITKSSPNHYYIITKSSPRKGRMIGRGEGPAIPPTPIKGIDPVPTDSSRPRRHRSRNCNQVPAAKRKAAPIPRRHRSSSTGLLFRHTHLLHLGYLSRRPHQQNAKAATKRHQ